MKKLTETQLNKIVNILAVLALLFTIACTVAGLWYCEVKYPTPVATQAN